MNFSSIHNIFSWSQKEELLILERVLIIGEIRFMGMTMIGRMHMTV